MIVNNITLPIYDVGDEVEYIGGQDEAGKKMFLLEHNISPPYVVTAIGINTFQSNLKKGKEVLKYCISINHSERHEFVAWMFQKIIK